MTYAFTDYLTMMGATFFMVFLLGLQSKNVNQSRYVAAIVTSFGISVANFTFIKYAATGDLLAFWLCAFGGCSGIAFSIWFSDHVLKPRYAKGGTVPQETPTARFGELPEWYRPIDQKTRQSLQKLASWGIPDAAVADRLHKTGIPTPGETHDPCR